MLQFAYLLGWVAATASGPLPGTLSAAAGFCAWSPLVLAPAAEVRSSEALAGNSSSNSRHTGTDASAGGTWRGPQACAREFCVYSNPSFADGRGIALITTARNAEVMMSQLPGGPLDDAGDRPATGPLFHTTEIPGKGVGLVAARHIRRGQRIMAHTPAVLVHRQLVDKLADTDKFRLFEVAVDQLPEPTRQLFLSQMGHFGGHRISDIMNTNSFEMHLSTHDGHHFANFPEVSRFNHDCRPKWVVSLSLSSA